VVAEHEQKLNGLVNVSETVMNYLIGSAGKIVPDKTVERLMAHANNCRKWLIDCASDPSDGHWLDNLTSKQRHDFEWSVLPYCLLVKGKNLVEAYELVGDCLGDKSFIERFPDSSAGDLTDLMRSTRLEGINTPKGAKSKEGIVHLASLAIPAIMKDNAVLFPEVYCALVDYRQFPNFKIIIHAAFNELIPEAMAHRALDAIGWEHEGPRSHNIVSSEIRVYSPRLFPVLRQRITGMTNPSAGECSTRLSGVMKSILEGDVGQAADFLVEAVDMSPSYRKDVMPLDLAESVIRLIDKTEDKIGDRAFQDALDGLGRLFDKLALTTREMNYVLAKSSSGGEVNGMIFDRMAGEEHLMLRFFLQQAKSREYDKDPSSAALIHSTLLRRCDKDLVKMAIEDDSKLAALVYAMTNDKGYLALVKDGAVRDECFGRDLGL